MLLSRLSVISLGVVVLLLLVGSRGNVDRSVRIMNDSGVRVEVYWVHPTTQETSLLSTPHIFDGATFPLNTYVGHNFQLREVPSEDTGVCESEDETCHIATFTVSGNDDQVLRVKKGLMLEFSDSMSVAKEEAGDVISECQQSAYKLMEESDGSTEVSISAVEALAACVEKGVARKLEEANEEIAFQARIRTEMAGLLENYTCIDENAPASPDVSSHVWEQGDGIPRLVHVKHDRPSSQIHVVEDFASEEECVAMEESARATLHRATVADGKGGSRYSESRKAMQAGIKVPWVEESNGNPITRLSRRVYDYTNNVLGLGIEEFGQEDLMSIQYFGRGRNDTAPDRYTPHCDGDCTGLPHKTGTRMATMVMYCTLPNEGGATNFRNAGVHVKPVKGSAVFFSYINPKTMVMDTGFTEHSGCPVFDGEKKIVTQWVRYGVDNDNPWDSFNTLGIKRADAANQ
mmetsp:Transcript_6042/g.10557  ORF Transcript_6042/g.10557 Transcript_6042/m.10557 type:complete len:460 (-) Transcript_6042:52-1431(-)